MKLSEVIAGLSSDLADNAPGAENVTWSKDDLTRWWNEARCVVASLRPDKYTCSKRIKLCEGAIQKHCDCLNITEILGQVDTHGNIVGQVRRSSTSTSVRWTKRMTCLSLVSDGSPQDFKVTSYSPTKMGDGTFLVEPAVPAGAEVYLQVMCRINPTPLSNMNDSVSDLDCSLYAVVSQWVIARAYQTQDGGDSAQRATFAFNLFFKLLNIQYNAEMVAKGAVLLPTGAKA